MDDVELALSLWGNPEVMRLMGKPYSHEQVIARLRGEIFTLGFHLLPEHWGRGYAPEAARAVISYARSVLKAKTLYAGHHPQNDKSRRVLESLGFEYWREELFEPTGLMHRGYLLELT